MRLLPGWLAGQADGVWTLDGDESIRRRPVDRIAEPLRRMGARLEAREGRFPPLTVAGAPLHGHRVRAAGRLGAGQVVRAARRAAGRRARRRVIEPAPSRDHTERMLARGRRARRARRRRGDRAPAGRARGRATSHVPGDPSSAAFHVAAAVLVPGSRIVLEGIGANWTRVGFLRIAQRMGAVVVGPLEEPRDGIPADEPVAELDVARLGRSAARWSRPTRCRWRSTSCRSSRCSAASPRARRSCAAPRSCGSRRPTASPPSSTACAASAPTSRRPRTASPCAGTGGLRGGVIDAHGDHRLAMLGAVAGLASREGVEVVGMEAAAVSYPGFTADLERLLSRARPNLLAHGHRHRRSRRGRKVHRRPRRRGAARLHVPRHRGDVPRVALAAAARRRRPAARSRAARGSSSASACCSTART